MGTIWTIGHSTLAIETFIGLLQTNGIKLLADVRRFPMSRRYPHFNGENLEISLKSVGIAFRHFPNLGGRRRSSADSVNLAWRNEHFRGYADYMATPDFQAAIRELADAANADNVAVMCAEAVWWRCHRGLISDYFKVRNWEVLHISSTGKTEPHPMTPAASVVNGQLSYAGNQAELIKCTSNVRRSDE